jgi:hypothetical protein
MLAYRGTASTDMGGVFLAVQGLSRQAVASAAIAGLAAGGPLGLVGTIGGAVDVLSAADAVDAHGRAKWLAP